MLGWDAKMADTHGQRVDDARPRVEEAGGLQSLTLQAIRAHIGGELSGQSQPDTRITGVNSLDDPGVRRGPLSGEDRHRHSH